MHNTPTPPPSRPRPFRRPRALWVLGALVLGAHLAVLQQAPATVLAAPARAAPPTPERAALPVQVLHPTETLTALAAAPASPGVRPPPARPETRPRTAEADAASPPSIAAKATPASADEPEANAPSTALASAPPATGGLIQIRAERAAGADTTPQAPPSARLDYRLQRGLLQGSGVLEWHNDGPRYRLRLEGQLPLLGSIFVQQSEGGFDAAGLAPLRHTEQRLRRSERAVNFVRPSDGSAPRITFSASTDSLPLRPGAQDRVSWMAQIATRLAGVRRLPAGSHLEMDVASTGGEVQHWVFVLQQIEADGRWHWRRQSEQPDDTLAEVWTDPALGHWPQRVRLTERRGDPLELTLRQMQALPP